MGEDYKQRTAARGEQNWERAYLVSSARGDVVLQLTGMMVQQHSPPVLGIKNTIRNEIARNPAARERLKTIVALSHDSVMLPDWIEEEEGTSDGAARG